MMKKIFTIFLALTMVVGLLAGCGKKNDAETGEADSDKLKVVTTIFPEYDWVRAILGDKADNAEITMLLDNGVDLHSYQPTADDIVRISDCDLFVYVGGESDGWVESVLKNAANKNVKVINLLEIFDGDMPVIFYLEDTKQKLAAPRRLYTSGHPLFFKELERLLGAENVATK